MKLTIPANLLVVLYSSFCVACVANAATPVVAYGSGNSLTLQSAKNPNPASNPSPAGVFDVRHFGATGDGRTLDTAAIQAALDACDRAGGGTVKFPSGTYLSQPITLRSKTTLHLDKGATLLASPDQKDFMKIPGDWLAAKGGDFIPFISGKQLTGVAITGKGTIDGNGKNWWGAAEEARIKTPGYTLPRPNLIALTDCQNVRLSGVHLVNSPKFHFVPAGCDNVVVEDVTILSPAGAANTDGIDPSNCRNVTITRCHIDTGDDNIAIKSGKKVEGREFGCENISVTDCEFLHGHGMSIGSETVGGVRHLVVKNCRFENTDNGLRIKSRRDRGGTVEDITYTGITMKNVQVPISMVCYYQNGTTDTFPKDDPAQPVTATTPIFRNIRISNMTATSTTGAGQIVGLPESLILNVVLENVRITAAEGLTLANVEGVQLKNVKIQAATGRPLILFNAKPDGLAKL